MWISKWNTSFSFWESIEKNLYIRQYIREATQEFYLSIKPSHKFKIWYNQFKQLVKGINFTKITHHYENLFVFKKQATTKIGYQNLLLSVYVRQRYKMVCPPRTRPLQNESRIIWYTFWVLSTTQRVKFICRMVLFQWCLKVSNVHPTEKRNETSVQFMKHKLEIFDVNH